MEREIFRGREGGRYKTNRVMATASAAANPRTFRSRAEPGAMFVERAFARRAYRVRFSRHRLG